MKKQIKILLILLLCIALLPTGVYATKSVKINAKTYINTGTGDNVVAKFKTSDGYGYCITPAKTGPLVDDILYLKNTINSGGLVYLIDQSNTSDYSYLVTQLAIWKYANGFVKSASDANWAAANNLVNNAKNNSNYSTTPSVAIKTNSYNMTESGNYYKSDKITLSVKNIKNDLNLKFNGAPTGTKVLDVNGNEKTSFKDGDIIYISVPISNVSSKLTYTIELYGTGYNTYLERYASSDSRIQELLILRKAVKKVSNSINMTITPVVRTCTYYNGKYYGKDGKIVDKTTYSIECEKHSCEKIGDKYFGKDGTEVGPVTFDKECNKHVCEIVSGSYFGKDGYEVDAKTYDKDCNKHLCQIIDGTYFGNDGSVVDATTYNNQCVAKPQVIVPNTADFDGLVYIIIGTLLIGGTCVVLRTLQKNS